MPVLIIAVALLLAACSSYDVPPGMQNQTTFTQSIARDYRDVYKVLSKQMDVCFNTSGGFILADKYSGARSVIFEDLNAAEIEVYDLKFGGGGIAVKNGKPFRFRISIRGTNSGTEITTEGGDPGETYHMHKRVPQWLGSFLGC